ncbi:MAG TPA: CHAD domain-containing protein, partial [Hyphomicrobiaceae bacterium]|nr:CHAD domain-containing protein [Hyphomicrobiaceae bacterium]
MAYRLRLDEPVGRGVRRIALEQIEIAEGKLASRSDVSAAIHDTRRSLKRLRALLRLAQPGFDEALFRAETERLVAIGKLLSGARDLDVISQTLARLEPQLNATRPGMAGRLQAVVGHRLNADRRKRRDHRRLALERLAQTKKFFSGKAPLSIELDHLIEGLGRSYRKARQAFRNAYAEPGDEPFHALRKRVQLHWRHMALLSRAWPDVLSARAAEAKELSRLLGEDHDYSILVGLAKELGDSVLEPEDAETLAVLCASCQTDLRA